MVKPRLDIHDHKLRWGVSTCLHSAVFLLDQPESLMWYLCWLILWLPKIPDWVPSSSSLCCCVTGRLYRCTGPMTAADISSWWAASTEDTLVIGVPGPHHSMPVCSSRADLPCPWSVLSLKVLPGRSTQGGCLCICLALLSIAHLGWQFSMSLIQAPGLSTMPREFMVGKACESPCFQQD